VSDWRPTAAKSAWELRARLLAESRAFFAERGVLEVETPLLGRHAVTDPHLSSIAAQDTASGARFYLQTSPEYAMTRMLAAGAPDIYQIGVQYSSTEETLAKLGMVPNREPGQRGFPVRAIAA